MDQGRNSGCRATGAILTLPYNLSLKAKALHLAARTSEALEALREAKALVERSEERWWCAELHRLRGVLLAALGAHETQIDASFCEAIRIAKEQKSVSLEKRAEATYAEYRRQKERVKDVDYESFDGIVKSLCCTNLFVDMPKSGQSRK